MLKTKGRIHNTSLNEDLTYTLLTVQHQISWRTWPSDQAETTSLTKSILRPILSTFTLVEQPHESHRERGQRRRFLKHAFAGTIFKGRAAWRHDISVQILTNVKRCISCARESNALGTHIDIIVDGANAVDSFVVRSKKTMHMVVPPDDTTLVYNSLRVTTSPSMDTGKKCREPLASCQRHLPGTILQRNGNIRRRRDDVSASNPYRIGATTLTSSWMKPRVP